MLILDDRSVDENLWVWIYIYRRFTCAKASILFVLFSNWGDIL